QGRFRELAIRARADRLLAERTESYESLPGDDWHGLWPHRGDASAASHQRLASPGNQPMGVSARDRTRGLGRRPLGVGVAPAAVVRPGPGAPPCRSGPMEL